MEEQVAGDLEEKVSPEENSREKSELFAGNTERAVHGQGGETDVDPVEVSDDIKDQEEGKEPPPKLSKGPGFDVTVVNRGCAQTLDYTGSRAVRAKRGVI